MKRPFSKQSRGSITRSDRRVVALPHSRKFRIRRSPRMFKNLRSSRSLSLVSLVFVFALLATPILGQRRQSASGPPSSSGGPDPLKVLQWRSIGPFRGGRVTAVAGVASQPMVFYFGGTGGGVWKSMDCGINWEPVTGGTVFVTGSVGAVGLADSEPNPF